MHGRIQKLLSEDCWGSAKTLQGLVRYVQSPAPLSDGYRLLVKGWGVGNCLKDYELKRCRDHTIVLPLP
jgi:hypothetical protein